VAASFILAGFDSFVVFGDGQCTSQKSTAEKTQP
jgi:hypothetical protein